MAPLNAEAEVFAFLDRLRASGVTPPYTPQVIREFGLAPERAVDLCTKWNDALYRDTGFTTPTILGPKP